MSQNLLALGSKGTEIGDPQVWLAEDVVDKSDGVQRANLTLGEGV